MDNKIKFLGEFLLIFGMGVLCSDNLALSITYSGIFLSRILSWFKLSTWLIPIATVTYILAGIVSIFLIGSMSWFEKVGLVVAISWILPSVEFVVKQLLLKS